MYLCAHHPELLEAPKDTHKIKRPTTADIKKTISSTDNKTATDNKPS
jgi:hypothetical protein